MKCAFSYFRLRSGGGAVGTSKGDDDDELEEVSDSEFDKLLDEQERGWENKTGKKFDYNYIATPKERKKMKRKNEHKMDSEFQELDDDEPDFDDLYSDQSDHDEGSDDGMDFEFEGRIFFSYYVFYILWLPKMCEVCVVFICTDDFL